MPRAAATPEGLIIFCSAWCRSCRSSTRACTASSLPCPAAALFFREYALHRNGFEGLLKVRLADKQIRHLQGVTDQIITLEPGTESFKYLYRFPPARKWAAPAGYR